MADQVLLPQSIFHSPVLDIKDEIKKKKILDLLSGFILPRTKLSQIQTAFLEEADLGLALKPSRKSCFLMQNTFVPSLPDGSEHGDYLSLDLGSTNFRVLLTRLRPNLDKKEECLVKFYDVPESLRVGSAIKLFDFLAQSIADFIQEFLPNHDKTHKEPLPLGFCFSFPMTQQALDVGILVTWTKNFDCPDAVGQDAVKLLRDAVERKGLKVNIVAILNDTTGTLIRGAYLDPNCAIGLIMGSGGNACYLEQVSRIEKWTQKDEAYKGVEEVVINMECGAFGDNGKLDFVRTQFDRQLDEESLFPNSFRFEKFFGGVFVGEILRLVLIKLTQEKLLFNGVITEELKSRNSIKASDLSSLDSENGESHVSVLATRLGYNQDQISLDDIKIIRHSSSLISVRNAVLLSSILASLLVRINKPNVTIAVDGSVYKKHPKMHQLMTDFITQLVPQKSFKLILAEDGSGKGAGLVAAIADRFSSKHKTSPVKK